MSIKKKGVVVGIAVSIVISTMTVCIIQYKNGKLKFSINDVAVQASNVIELEDYIENNIKTYIGDIDISDATKLVYDTKKYHNISFKEWISLTGSTQDIQIDKIYDINELREILIKYNLSQLKSKDAKIVKTVDKFIIEKEQYGTEINIDKIVNDIQDSEIDSLEGYCIQPVIREQDLSDIVAKANEKIDWSVTYDNGETYKIPIENIEIDLENNKVVTDNSFIDTIVDKLEDYYDNIGKGIQFRTASDSVIDVKGGTWGTLMNSEEERLYLQELFDNNKTEVNRRPVMKQDFSKIGDTYIEISLSDQHIWHYEDGELIRESSIVTGDTSKNRNTPSGVYFISERINGKYLRGTGYVTWVNKWMRLTNTGIGLHDAGWRGSFGGNIYKYNGSHGCINLPKKFAYELYEDTHVGMPVIVY